MSFEKRTGQSMTLGKGCLLQRQNVWFAWHSYDRVSHGESPIKPMWNMSTVPRQPLLNSSNSSRLIIWSFSAYTSNAYDGNIDQLWLLSSALCPFSLNGPYRWEKLSGMIQRSGDTNAVAWRARIKCLCLLLCMCFSCSHKLSLEKWLLYYFEKILGSLKHCSISWYHSLS